MELTKYNIIKCGYFPENLPQSVFTTKKLISYLKKGFNKVDGIERNLRNAGILSTPCILISCYKNELERRIISVPHIETFIILANEIQTNNPKIEKMFLENHHSYSNDIKPYEIEGYEVRSNFYKNYLERTSYSLGFKYLLKVDLSKCYENIYTHSITWAMLGKENAKIEFKKLEKDRSEEYKKYDKFDNRIRAINNNETKGIPTGPLTSRIISEIVLTEVDNELKKVHQHFKRYVDDYNFLFKTQTDAEIFLPQLQRILYDYKLHINTEKTEILKYPYSINHNLRLELGKYDIEKYGYISYIERFNELFLLGNKGALKFGLKVLISHNITENEKEVVHAHLINLMISYPNLSEYVFKISEKNEFNVTNRIKVTLNTLLEENFNNGHDIELIWILLYMIKFKIEVNTKMLCSILAKQEVFSSIIALDYIYKNELFKLPTIKNAVENMRAELKKESIYGEKWLLIYEACLNKWIKGLNENVKKSKFLKELIDNKVEFFISPLN